VDRARAGVENKYMNSFNIRTNYRRRNGRNIKGKQALFVLLEASGISPRLPSNTPSHFPLLLTSRS